MFCFIFYALFLCCNALIHLGCTLGWHVKKECVWAPVPWKAEPEGKLVYWRFAGRGIPGHQEWEKENEEAKRGKRKENQRWCFVTRTAPVSEENTAIFQMQDVSRGRGWLRWSVSPVRQGVGRRKELICQFSISFLLMAKVCASELHHANVPGGCWGVWAPWTQRSLTWLRGPPWFCAAERAKVAAPGRLKGQQLRGGGLANTAGAYHWPSSYHWPSRGCKPLPTHLVGTPLFSHPLKHRLYHILSSGLY